MLPVPAGLVETSVMVAGVADPSACRLRHAPDIMVNRNLIAWQ
jgi:hypothetical protein